MEIAKIDNKKAENVNMNALLQAIASIECMGLALSDMLSQIHRDHFENTLAGACLNHLDLKSRKNALLSDEHKGAYLWMIDHYSSASASVYALSLLAENLYEKAETFYGEIFNLMKKECDE